jgi:DNA-binding CsgD family transcriptional regulator
MGEVTVPKESSLTVPRAAVVPLTRLGLSADADLVYRTLTGFGAQSVGRLSSSLGLTAFRIRTALDELTSLGAAIPATVDRRRAGEARTWTAAPPDSVVSTLRTRQEQAARARFHLNRKLLSIAEISHLVGAPDLARLDAVRLLPGPQVHRRFVELGARTRHEMWSVQPEPTFSAAVVAKATEVDRSTADRGVAIRTLGVPAGVGDASDDYTTEMTDLDTQYRELPSQPVKMLIFDRTTALLPLVPGDPSRGALELTADSAVDGLVGLFHRQWERSRPPDQGATRRMKLTPRERAVIRLLAAGHTDATTSEALGLSARTIAYTLRSLMDRYGAQNRFQLGLMLGAYANDDVTPPLPTDDGEE